MIIDAMQKVFFFFPSIDLVNFGIFIRLIFFFILNTKWDTELDSMNWKSDCIWKEFTSFNFNGSCLQFITFKLFSRLFPDTACILSFFTKQILMNARRGRLVNVLNVAARIHGEAMTVVVVVIFYIWGTMISA